MGYLTLYKIFDNILPLSGTASADLESGGLLGDSADRFMLEQPKRWEFERELYRFAVSNTHKPC